MQKIIPLIIIVILIPSFFFGVIVGHYQITPFEVLSNIKQTLTVDPNESNIERLQIYQDKSDMQNLISFETISDIEKTKQNLFEYIWNDYKLPTNSFAKHDIDIEDQISTKLQNLERIDSFTVEMDYGMDSISYLFLAENTNEKLIIFHQGHDSISLNGFDNHSFDQDIPLIQNFLDNNYSVLIFSMPGKGMNNEPIINHEKFGTFKLNSHNHFEFLESENFHPLRFFLEPVVVTLNQIEKNFTFDSFAMIGISGGGWTTVLISAIDDRIDESYSVAGSFPIWLRFDSRDFGDYEQTIPEFYQIANYLELYFLSSYSNRSLILFYNEFDSCCFSGEIYNQAPFEDAVQSKLSKFGENNFQVIIDRGQTEHKISDFTLQKILNHLQSNS